MANAQNPSDQAEKKNHRVLIADDDLPTRMLLRAAVSRWGYETIEASDGEAAWDILTKPDAPRLLILDWLMPKLDGLALCERIKQKLPFHPYTIILTQLTGTTNVIKALEAGADEFLSKPFNTAELHSRLSTGSKIIEYEDILTKKNLQLENYIKQSGTENLSPTQLIALLEKFIAKNGGKIGVKKAEKKIHITLELPAE